ncbi:MAG: hypothetical protein KF847_19695 [Pirellulales bacterium]|nr:hypothetical protein [Pirellulales bacterium]
MSSFDRQYQSGFHALLEHLGEEIEYRPEEGEPRPIRAVVERDLPIGIPEIPRSMAPSTRVSVLDDEALGISRAALNTARDMIGVATKAGGTLEGRAIGSVEVQAGGVLRLEVR